MKYSQWKKLIAMQWIFFTCNRQTVKKNDKLNISSDNKTKLPFVMRVTYIIIRNIVSYILFESNYSNIVYFFEFFVSAFYKDFSYYVSLRTLSFLYYFLYLPFIHFFSVFNFFTNLFMFYVMHIGLSFIFTFLFKVGYDDNGIVIVFMILFYRWFTVTSESI